MEKSKRGLILRAVLGVLTFVGLILAAYKFLDVQALLKAWNRFSWESWFWLLVLPAVYLLAKAIRFRILVKPVSDAPAKDVVLGYSASQAASLLPGGVAMRAAMMHRLGIPVEKSAGPVLANSASDQFLLLMTGLGLCYYYPEVRAAGFILTAILLTLIALIWIQTTREWLCRTLLSLSSRIGQKKRMERLLDTLPYLADLTLFRNVMAWTLVANVCSLLALFIIVGSLGLEVEPWPLTAAFVVPNLLGRLSPFPAGAGVVEAGMVGFIAAQTSMSFDQAAVATIIFRVVDILLPAFYGGLCHLFLPKDQSDQPDDQPKYTRREAIA